MNAKQREVLARLPAVINSDYTGRLAASNAIYISRDTGLAGWRMGEANQELTAVAMALLCEECIHVGRVFPDFYVLTITPLGREVLGAR